MPRQDGLSGKLAGPRRSGKRCRRVTPERLRLMKGQCFWWFAPRERLCHRGWKRPFLATWSELAAPVLAAQRSHQKRHLRNELHELPVHSRHSGPSTSCFFHRPEPVEEQRLSQSTVQWHQALIRHTEGAWPVSRPSPDYEQRSYEFPVQAISCHWARGFGSDVLFKRTRTVIAASNSQCLGWGRGRTARTGCCCCTVSRRFVSQHHAMLPPAPRVYRPKKDCRVLCYVCFFADAGTSRTGPVHARA